MKDKNLDISKRLKKVEVLLLDVDGVLTDGSIIYNDNNEETKVFSVKDGLGIRLLMESGIRVGIVTGRSSNALAHRCKNLGITNIYDGVRDKATVLTTVMNQTRTTADQIAFVGDDLPDLSIMKKAGVSIAVADAHEMVREQADMITSAKGGAGAVREICDKIIKAKGLWEKALEYFL